MAALATRYVASHGPVTERDLAGWCNQNLTFAREAVALAGDAVTSETIGGQAYLVAAERPEPEQQAARSGCCRLRRVRPGLKGPVGDPLARGGAARGCLARTGCSSAPSWSGASLRRHLEPQDHDEAHRRLRHPVRVAQRDPAQQHRAGGGGVRSGTSAVPAEVTYPDPVAPPFPLFFFPPPPPQKKFFFFAYCRPRDHAANAPGAATRRPQHHGDPFDDHYAWMADRDDALLAPTSRPRTPTPPSAPSTCDRWPTQVFEEFRSRIEETDLSVPCATTAGGTTRAPSRGSSTPWRRGCSSPTTPSGRPSGRRAARG